MRRTVAVLNRAFLQLSIISLRHFTISAMLRSAGSDPPPRTSSRSFGSSSRSSVDFSRSVLRSRSLSDNWVTCTWPWPRPRPWPWRRYLLTASLSSLLSSCVRCCSNSFSRKRSTCRAFSTYSYIHTTVSTVTMTLIPLFCTRACFSVNQ